MKKSLFAALGVAFVLLGCSGPRDTKLSEMNEPKQAIALREELSNEEVALLRKYVVTRTMNQTIDYKVTVGDAIDEQRKLDADIKNAVDSIK